MQQEQDAARLVEIEQQRDRGRRRPAQRSAAGAADGGAAKLKRLHLETRAATLAKQLATLTGLPVGSITPDHASIPEIPAVTADEAARLTPGIESAQALARSRERVAKGDQEHLWLLPEIGFGALYNRNTTLLNNINYVLRPTTSTPTTSAPDSPSASRSSTSGLHAKAKESAAEALRARVEAEQAQQQNDIQIAELTGSLRELDAQAEIASLKQQIASEQLKSVMAQLELGNGAGNAPGAPPQLSPTAEQQARIDERQKYRGRARRRIRPEQSPAEPAARPRPHAGLAKRAAQQIDRDQGTPKRTPQAHTHCAPRKSASSRIESALILLDLRARMPAAPCTSSLRFLRQSV